MTSQKFLFQNGTSHRDSIFTPWNRAKHGKNHFLCLKTSFLAQIYTPLCISMALKRNKKFVCSIFRDVSFQKQLQQPPPPPPPLVNRFCKNSAKMCLTDKNKKSLNLEVLDRGVLEFRVMVNNLMVRAKKFPPPP